jgi:hypothetical protein
MKKFLKGNNCLRKFILISLTCKIYIFIILFPRTRNIARAYCMIHNVLTIVDNFIVFVSRIINITFLFLCVLQFNPYRDDKKAFSMIHSCPAHSDEEMIKLCDFEGNIEEQLQNIPVTRYVRTESWSLQTVHSQFQRSTEWYIYLFRYCTSHNAYFGTLIRF